MAFNFSFLFHLIVSLFFLLNHPIFSFANNLHKTKPLFNSQLFSEDNGNAPTPAPTTYFEVTKPIQLPKTKPCSYLILQHDFGFTYGKPPVFANYTPPSNCPSQKFSKIVFEWKASSKGRQFDRIFGVWLGGVEILRSCTAEPRATGIVWTVEKDITRYYSLLMTNQTLAVYLGNLVDKTYTGIYHVNISVHFYPAEENYGFSGLNIDDSANSGADLILPISRNLPLNDGLWFEIQNSTDVESKEFRIPPNVYRAVLEVYVSFHENDEFWYGNFPNEYIAANNLTGYAGNGPFREVLVSLDDVLAGSIWPFTVVYTGGIDPLLWRPITGIGSFDLPTYDIEITPFLGKILDGKTHKLGFSVANALNVWYIDANLHLWLDKKSAKTEGELLSHDSPPLTFSFAANFTGLDGSFFINASRTITSEGWVKSSSYGTIITKATQDLKYRNFMVLGNEANRQIVNQTIEFNDMVSARTLSSVKSIKSLKHFPFYLYTDVTDRANGTYVSVSNVALGFDEKKIKKSDQGLSVSCLKNIQKGNSSMLVKGNLVISGLGTTNQAYSYKDNEFCYLRNVGSSNYTILYDKVSNICSKRQKHHLFNRFLPS
ncbi:peptide-N4-(N-acetyl-beta-glucosaminyl)asparagine amidase A [Coffea eugenioides]|uniref:peptide-N4-(N-acetyl-beta- glucosaminyl)asparagine amidase A n=1 Tax=Coffea eugenioides TaxID=49369 RepID=UPI000F614B09|nr:peptide-N4-(N-acetyl-beta-glucosaminyl)asparagine amidase A [Coffea eugenioides]